MKSRIIALLLVFSLAFAIDIKYITLSFVDNWESGTCFDADGMAVPCGNETTMQVAFLSDSEGQFTLKVEIPQKGLSFEKQVDIQKGWNYFTIGELGLPGRGICKYNVSIWDDNRLVKWEVLEERCYEPIQQRKWKKVSFVPIPTQFTFGEIRIGKTLVNETRISIGLGDRVWLYIRNYSNGILGYFAESCARNPDCLQKSCNELLQRDSSSDIFKNVIKPLLELFPCGASSGDKSVWCGEVWSCIFIGGVCKGVIPQCPETSNGVCFYPMNESYYYQADDEWTWPLWTNKDIDFGEKCTGASCTADSTSYRLFGACKDNQRCEYKTYRVYRYHYNWTISYNAMITVENRNETVVAPLGYNQTLSVGEMTSGLCSGDKVCFTKISVCGDGVCDVKAGERCWNCPEDCGCGENCTRCEDDYTGLVDARGCLLKKAGIEEVCMCNDECRQYTLPTGIRIPLVCVKKEFASPEAGVTQPLDYNLTEPYGRCLPEGYWWDPYHNGDDFTPNLPIDNTSIPGVGRIPREIHIECRASKGWDAWWVCGCLGHLRQTKAWCDVSNFGTKPETVRFTINWRRASVWNILGCNEEMTSYTTLDYTILPNETKRYVFKIECGGPGYCQQALAPVWVDCPDGTDVGISPMISTTGYDYPIYATGNTLWHFDWGACGCGIKVEEG